MPKSLCEGERGEPKYIRGEIDLDLTALTFSNHLNIGKEAGCFFTIHFNMVDLSRKSLISKMAYFSFKTH